MPKDFSFPIPFITNANIAVDYTSSEIDVISLDRIGIDVSWTTSNVNGILYVQATIAGTNFSTLLDANDNPIAIAIAGTSSFQAFDIDVKAFSKIRIFFDRTSGSLGTLNGSYLSKGRYNV